MSVVSTVAGVDEQTIIDILTRRSYPQRREIAFEYERLAKKVWRFSFCHSEWILSLTFDIFTLQDLMTALKGALSGSLEALMLGLMRSTTQYDAFELKNSVKVWRGRDNSQLVPGSRWRHKRYLLNVFRVWGRTRRHSSSSSVRGAVKKWSRLRRFTKKVRWWFFSQ